MLMLQLFGSHCNRNSIGIAWFASQDSRLRAYGLGVSLHEGHLDMWDFNGFLALPK